MDLESLEVLTVLLLLVILYRLRRVFRFRRRRRRSILRRILKPRLRLPKLPRYRKQTFKQTYSSTQLGEFGEQGVIEKLRKFEKQGGRILSNLYIPKPNEETTEIDVVFIHPRGFFVIESKNYNGWIFGSEKNQYWTQTLPVGEGRKSHKEKFYNPLKQNDHHIKHLKRVLSEDIPMWSLVVFSDECSFKSVNVPSNQSHKLIQLHQLETTIRVIIDEQNKVLFSGDDIDWMYEELNNFMDVDDKIKVSHIEYLNIEK